MKKYEHTPLGRLCEVGQMSEFVRDRIILLMVSETFSVKHDYHYAEIERSCHLQLHQVEDALPKMAAKGLVRSTGDRRYCLTQAGLDYYNATPHAAKRYSEE